MLRLTLAATMGVAVLFFTAPASAENSFAVGAQAGTDGLGVVAQAKFTQRIALRAGYHDLSYDIDDENYDDITYNGDLEFQNIAASIEYHPFNNGWFIGGGAYFGDKMIGLAATPNGSVEIGDATFTSAEIGILTAETKLADTAPYIGLGFDNAVFGGNSPLGFHASIGVMLTDTPEVSLVSTGGTLSDDATFQAELAREEQNLQDELDGFEYYPIAKVGVSLRF